MIMLSASLAVAIALGIVVTKGHYHTTKGVVGNSIVPLNDVITIQFTSSVMVQWNRTNICFGRVIRLVNQDCLHDERLMKQDSTSLAEVPDYLPIFMLQSSTLSIFIPLNESLTGAFLYLIRSIKTYEDVVSQSCCLTTVNCQSAENCYRIGDHLGSWINKTINESDFYNVLLINDDNANCERPDKYCILSRLDYDITYLLNIVSFNYTYIYQLMDGSSAPPVDVKSDPVRLTIFKWFSYHHTCYLLNYTCDKNKVPPSDLFIVNGTAPREDIVTAMVVFYAAVCICCVLLMVKCHKTR